MKPDDIEQQTWYTFNRIERINTLYGQKIALRMDNGNLLTLPYRYGTISDVQIQEINNLTEAKQFRIIEKKVLSKGNYTHIYEFSNNLSN